MSIRTHSPFILLDYRFILYEPATAFYRRIPDENKYGFAWIEPFSD